MKPFRLSFGSLFLLFLVLGCLHFAFWPGSGRDWIEVEVKTGNTGHDVVNRLKEKGAVFSRTPFLFWMKVRRGDGKIKVGLYRFSEGRSAYWMVDDVIKGRTRKIRVTIPEGFASWQIAERLHTLRICSKEDFLAFIKEKAWEGFLFPATYDLDLGESADQVAQFFKSQFDKKWTSKMDQEAKALGWTQKEVVTLASIIEREVRLREELPKIAAVYHNRLKKGMLLQADPTVQYAMGYWKQRLTYADYKKVNSPYNTYQNKGLPPGPICSPGVDSIEAVLWPDDFDALFFVAQSDGRHDFSRTYREHVNKVNHRNNQKRR